MGGSQSTKVQLVLHLGPIKALMLPSILHGEPLQIGLDHLGKLLLSYRRGEMCWLNHCSS